MRIGLMAAVVGLAGSLALGSGVSAADGTNAALVYYRAWATMDQDLHLGLISDDDEFAVSADGAERLAAEQESIRRLLEATRAGDVDWGIAYEKGFGALMPHLNTMRSSSRVLQADALRLMEAGDSAGAAERLGALYRMSDDVVGGRVLISSLVGMAIGNLGTKTIGHFVEAGKWTAADARVLLEAIGEGDDADRYRIQDAIVGEYRLMSEFIVANAPADEPGRWLMEQTMFAEEPPAAKRVLAMSREELLRELGGFAAYHGELLAAWDAQDAEQLEACEQRLVAGEFGALPELLAPSVSRAYASHVRAKAELEALIERLEEIAG